MCNCVHWGKLYRKHNGEKHTILHVPDQLIVRNDIYMFEATHPAHKLYLDVDIVCNQGIYAVDLTDIG